MSNFLALPAELRTEIYQNVFYNQRVSEMRSLDKGDTNLQHISTVPNILLTCRTAYADAVCLFYSMVTFIVGEDHPNQSFEARLGDKTGLVQHIIFKGGRCDILSSIETTFPKLSSLEIHLGIAMVLSDQMNASRAVRDMQRYNGGYLVHQGIRSHPTMPLSQIIRLQKLGESNSTQEYIGKSARGFTVTLHWGLDYRFLDFRGYIDIDEWVLFFWDSLAEKQKIYTLPQAPLQTSRANSH